MVNIRPEPLEEDSKKVVDATRDPVKCVQPEALNPLVSYTGQEDCLILNVYVPERNEAASNDEDYLPVMVFVHGGGFMTGDSGMYGPKYLLERDVILVTVNYRLGPLGFLNLGNTYHDINYFLLIIWFYQAVYLKIEFSQFFIAVVATSVK